MATFTIHRKDPPLLRAWDDEIEAAFKEWPTNQPSRYVLCISRPMVTVTIRTDGELTFRDGRWRPVVEGVVHGPGERVLVTFEASIGDYEVCRPPPALPSHTHWNFRLLPGAN